MARDPKYLVSSTVIPGVLDTGTVEVGGPHDSQPAPAMWTLATVDIGGLDAMHPIVVDDAGRRAVVEALGGSIPQGADTPADRLAAAITATVGWYDGEEIGDPVGKAVLDELRNAWRGADPTPRPRVYIQWKGTQVCMDVHCPCGAHLHFDDDFVYAVKCAACGAVWELGTDPGSTRNDAYGGVIREAVDGWEHDPVWPCMNPVCDNPGTVKLEVYGRTVGMVCTTCQGARPDDADALWRHATGGG